MDARLQARLGESLQEERAPEWTHRGNCAGRTTADWFCDDVADPGPLREPVFPDSVYIALAECHACPVLRQCIEWAYETTVPQVWGWGNIIDGTGKVTYAELKIDPIHQGIFGVPALIRERMDGPNRVEKCLEWLGRVSRQRHFNVTEGIEREEEVV